MSKVCPKGYKCMCFQCGEIECERYQQEPPEWVNKMETVDFMNIQDRIDESRCLREVKDGNRSEGKSR